MMNANQQTIYLRDIPSGKTGRFWVSFENHPRMQKTRADIYGRCLPCIQNLYHQLKAGKTEINLGNAYHCWKITAVLDHIDTCCSLLERFSAHPVDGPIYGKMGTGRAEASTRVLVFHTQDETQRDRINAVVNACLEEMSIDSCAIISRACAVLYDRLLGDWRHWRPITPIRHPGRIGAHLDYLKKVLYESAI